MELPLFAWFLPKYLQLDVTFFIFVLWIVWRRIATTA
nr:MAG TPA: hypothetical protein [Caudoviricetes sp.]